MYTDAPIIDKTQDEFKRFPFCQRVAQVIASREDSDSLVVGIYGAWGEGKTTAINFIEQELTEKENIICVKFNPWQFSNEDQLLMSFFETISNALGINLKDFIDKSSDFVNRYVQPVISPLINIFDKTKISGIVTQSLIKIIFSPSTLEKYKKKVKKILHEKQKKLVIFIDDIDRLDKSEIQAIFKLVKLSADFSYTTYVLAFDPDMVASALSEKYSSNSLETGREFLEKIIQVPLNLPKIKTSIMRKILINCLINYLEHLDIEFTDEKYILFLTQYINGLEIKINTPRMVKRYINTLTFSLSLLKDEVEVIDLIFVEGIKLCYPKVYQSIKNNPDLYLFNKFTIKDDLKEKVESIIQEATINLDITSKEAVLRLISFLFPRLSMQKIANLPYQSTDYGSLEKRVSETLYFDRYFSYAILNDDIADKDFKDLLDLANDSINDLDIKLLGLITRDNAFTFLRKLDNKIKKNILNNIQCKNLALIVSSNPILITDHLETTSHRVMLLINKTQDSFSVLKEIIYQSKSIMFCVYLIYFKHKDGITKEEIKTHSPQEQEIYKILCDKIKLYLIHILPNNFSENLESDLETILNMWTLCDDETKVIDFLNNIISQNTNLSNECNKFINDNINKLK
ncbi:P-loop NTPase fold protein [Geminocystis sp. NIES-3709]|uniref:KAP family P-loop NTPase fold protein n=1 Tax=Geminocystis sp. NIES-3709 TaxID=1617448 RepID=UPI0005FCC299|nr:P-loop NTPase fold protein [Geminocystis sp. NIES-3709]BAQ66348.1 phage T7 exclusion protein [Geminocystis sp. NIES-3709]